MINGRWQWISLVSCMGVLTIGCGTERQGLGRFASEVYTVTTSGFSKFDYSSEPAVSSVRLSDRDSVVAILSYSCPGGGSYDVSRVTVDSRSLEGALRVGAGRVVSSIEHRVVDCMVVSEDGISLVLSTETAMTNTRDATFDDKSQLIELHEMFEGTLSIDSPEESGECRIMVLRELSEGTPALSGSVCGVELDQVTG